MSHTCRRVAAVRNASHNGHMGLAGAGPRSFGEDILGEEDVRLQEDSSRLEIQSGRPAAAEVEDPSGNHHSHERSAQGAEVDSHGVRSLVGKEVCGIPVLEAAGRNRSEDREGEDSVCIRPDKDIRHEEVADSREEDLEFGR